MGDFAQDQADESSRDTSTLSMRPVQLGVGATNSSEKFCGGFFSMKLPIVSSPRSVLDRLSNTEGDDDIDEQKTAKIARRIAACFARLVRRSSGAMIGILSENQVKDGCIIVMSRLGTNVVFMSSSFLNAGRQRHRHLFDDRIEAWGEQWGMQRPQGKQHDPSWLMRFNRRCGLHSRAS